MEFTSSTLPFKITEKLKYKKTSETRSEAEYCYCEGVLKVQYQNICTPY
ncbi:hypothetical protein ACFP3I_14535 [Chryseobacterium arachidis]